MAHEITQFDSPMYAEKPAWHGLGTVVAEAPTSADAMKIANLDWEVEKRPLFTTAPVNTESEADSMSKIGMMKVDTNFATVRKDINQVLGVVGTRYQPLQNKDAFELMDSLVDVGDIRYESAGSLQSGKKVWLLARMKETYWVKDDQHVPYLLLANGHDGKMTVTIQPTMVRVVCANTLMAAMKSFDKVFHIRHTGKMNGYLDEARQVLGIMKQEQDQLHQLLTALSIKDATPDKVEEFLSAMFPLPTVIHVEEDARTIERIHGIRSEIANIFENDPTTQTEASKRTAFGLLNSLTYYTDHAKKGYGVDDDSREENRSRQAIFGSGADLKARGLETACRIFGV
jgi:phage/plasmid-like protein (TIGR03299 family)